MKYFPIRKEYRIEARFEAHAEPKVHHLAGSLGQPEQMKSPGVAHFASAVRSIRLAPFLTTVVTSWW